VKKKLDEKIMEGKSCHGEAIGTHLDIVNGNILDCNYSLKSNMRKERMIRPTHYFNEKKPFK
jgi:hypothetical protein